MILALLSKRMAEEGCRRSYEADNMDRAVRINDKVVESSERVASGSAALSRPAGASVSSDMIESATLTEILTDSRNTA
jgi:hypothetical protein